ncbi:unnamed protein product [Pylaiella littoralis]
MVQMAVINNNNGSLVKNGKQPGLVKNKSSNSIGSNGNGMVKAAANGGGGEGGKRGGGEGSAPRKLTKNEKRRQKNKQKKAQASEGAVVEKSMAEANGVAVASWPPPAAKGEASDVQIEYVADNSSVLDGAEMDEASLEEFKQIFERFTKVADEASGAAADAAEAEAEAAAAAAEAAKAASKKAAAAAGGSDEEDSEEEGTGPRLSRKARKLKSRLSVAELKQLVQRPDVVEAHDVTAADPRMLVFLKSYRNTVPVPRHWCQKRKYLQGKRGIEKTPFELPEFIAMTGIDKIRAAIEEADSLKKAKQKQRERVAPKMGKIDIDYQVLHDAFFKHQTKPPLTNPGDLYYEGKEFEAKNQEHKPGHVSSDLREALGIGEDDPPPWLINMQRYGPPLSYPHLRIPGLNAPIPAGARYGFGSSEWGKPPVDSKGNPLYGDVFNLAAEEGDDVEEMDKSHWGDLAESEEDDDDEDEEEDDDDDEDGGGGAETPMFEGGVSSVSGLETPDTMMDLRKRAGVDTPDTTGLSAVPQELYKVVPQKESAVGSAALFGGDRKYVLPGAKTGGAGAAGLGAGDASEAPRDVQVSLNPDEVDEQLNDEEGLREKFEEQERAAASGGGKEKEDVSDIVAEENRKRKRKLEKKEKEKAADKGKRYKDSFKF